VKVVLFCGGLGMRMRDGTTNAPKPMAMVGERPNVEVVDGQLLDRDTELGGGLAHLARERVGREPLGQRAGGDRERDIADLAAGLDEPRHRPAAAELAVVGVRREDEHLLPGLDHAAPTLSTGSDGGGFVGGAVAGAGFHRRTGISEQSAVSPSSPQNIGSSNSAL